MSVIFPLVRKGFGLGTRKQTRAELGIKLCSASAGASYYLAELGNKDPGLSLRWVFVRQYAREGYTNIISWTKLSDGYCLFVDVDEASWAGSATLRYTSRARVSTKLTSLTSLVSHFWDDVVVQGCWVTILEKFLRLIVSHWLGMHSLVTFLSNNFYYLCFPKFCLRVSIVRAKAECAWIPRVEYMCMAVCFEGKSQMKLVQ